MPTAPSSQSRSSTDYLPPESKVTLVESLEYSKQMIESLQKMADRQGHRLLAQLLKLAADEATSILKEAA